jgi:hypothetical protein
MKCLIELEALNKHRTSQAFVSFCGNTMTSSHICNSSPTRIQPVSGGEYYEAATREGHLSCHVG